MKSIRIAMIVILSIAAILISIILSLALGARAIPFEEVISTLWSYDWFGPGLGHTSNLNQLVVAERIPRTIFAMIAGGALGVAGALMQSLTRNPIADPSILGVNTGASLSVVIGISFFQIGNPSQYIWFSIVGAGLTAAFVYSIGSMGPSGSTPIKLTLAGTAVSAALSSIVSAIVLPRTEVMNQFRFWQVGSVSGATFTGILAVLPFIVVGLVIAFGLIHSLDVIALGEDMATGLGTKVGLIKGGAAFAGIVLCGAVTALAGPVGFVGLMVPHVVRMIFGSSQKYLIPLSLVGGGLVLTLSDVLGRLLAKPGEVEAGIITAFVGAPILIYVASKAKVTNL